MDPLILLRSQIFIVLYPSLSFHKFLDLLMIVIMMSVFLLNNEIQYKPYGIVLQVGLHKNKKDKINWTDTGTYQTLPRGRAAL